jgi:hypothetical protein
MATIDLYSHQFIGFINCPSDFDIIKNNTARKIAIYELEQDIPDDEKEFDGKSGDILIGGGRGEVPVLRLSIPNSFRFFFKDWDGFENLDEIFKSFWTATMSFKLCNGFLKTGWNPDLDIEFWLAENVCAFLVKHLKKYCEFDSVQLSFEKRLFDIQEKS